MNSSMNVEISNLRNEKQMMMMKMGEFQNNYKSEDIVRFRYLLSYQCKRDIDDVKGRFVLERRVDLQAEE